MRAVVQINPLKGAQYDLTYGVCCAWVPKSGTSSWLGRFPRTLKQTTLNMWVDHFTANALLANGWQRSTARGRSNTKRRYSRGRSWSVHSWWWRSVDSWDGALAEARRQALNRFDLHFPRARVVAAFTLARIGDVDAARAELSDDDDEDLQSLLTVVPKMGRP